MIDLKNFGRKLAGEQPLWKSIRNWEDKIVMDLREPDCIYGRWTELAQDRIQW
jgi:hypothetical protein